MFGEGHRFENRGFRSVSVGPETSGSGTGESPGPLIAGGEKVSHSLRMAGLNLVRFSGVKSARTAEVPDVKMDTPFLNWVRFVIFMVWFGVKG